MSESPKDFPYELDSDIGPLVAEQLQEGHANSVRPVVQLVSYALRRFELETVVEGHRFRSDESKRRGGGGVAPAPLRYFVAGIVMCTEAWVIKLAGLRSVPLVGLRAEAAAYLESDSTMPIDNGQNRGGRGFDRIEITLNVRTDWTKERDTDVLALGEEALRICPAAVSASRAMDLQLLVIHNGVAVNE